MLSDRGREGPEEIEKLDSAAAKREVQMAKGSLPRSTMKMVINDTVERAVEEIIKTVKHENVRVGIHEGAWTRQCLSRNAQRSARLRGTERSAARRNLLASHADATSPIE